MSNILSSVGCLGAWSSLVLPWWYISISGLGSLIKVSPAYLVTMGRAGKGVGMLQLSGGLYNLTLVAVALLMVGGIAGVYGSKIRKKSTTLIGGVLVLSSVNILTYAFVYLEVAGAVLCQTSSIYGGPLEWGLSYGFLLSAVSGIGILVSTLMD